MLRPTFLDHQHDTQHTSPNAMTSCWAATCWWPAWSSRAPASVKYGCRIIRPVGTISTAIEWFAGGQWVTLDAPLEKLPLLVRAGAGLPLSERISHVDAQKDDRRELQLFPLKGTGSTRGLLFEDDGESWAINRGMRYGWSGK